MAGKIEIAKVKIAPQHVNKVPLCRAQFPPGLPFCMQRPQPVDARERWPGQSPNQGAMGDAAWIDTIAADEL